MGNSVCGQMPSQTWSLLADQLKERTDLPYDRAAIEMIAKSELDLFNAMQESQIYKKNNPTMSRLEIGAKFKILNKTVVLSNAIYAYNKNEKYKLNESELTNSILAEVDEENAIDQMNSINCDIMLLDIVYGKKQCEYAISLMERTYAMVATLPNKDNALQVMRDIYRAESDGLVYKLRDDAVKDVDPCMEAFTMWQSWSVL